MSKLNPILESVSYANQFRGKTFLIKLGGSILQEENLIQQLCKDLQVLQSCGINLIIVHGGGHAINQHLDINHIESAFVDGLRVTSPEAMKIIEMVLCGHVNTLLVRKLNSIGIKSVGLTGADNNMLQCEAYSEQHGLVGTITSINSQTIQHCLSQQIIPVIAPIGVNEQGCAMNINADTAASQLASALKVDKLIYLTDQDGIYDENKNPYSVLSAAELHSLIQQKIVLGGMLTKTKAILSALSEHLTQVHILNGNKPQVLIEEFFTVKGVGTLCTA